MATVSCPMCRHFVLSAPERPILQMRKLWPSRGGVTGPSSLALLGFRGV